MPEAAAHLVEACARRPYGSEDHLTEVLATACRLCPDFARSLARRLGAASDWDPDASEIRTQYWLGGDARVDLRLGSRNQETILIEDKIDAPWTGGDQLDRYRKLSPHARVATIVPHERRAEASELWPEASVISWRDVHALTGEALGQPQVRDAATARAFVAVEELRSLIERLGLGPVAPITREDIEALDQAGPARARLTALLRELAAYLPLRNSDEKRWKLFPKTEGRDDELGVYPEIRLVTPFDNPSYEHVTIYAGLIVRPESRIYTPTVKLRDTAPDEADHLLAAGNVDVGPWAGERVLAIGDRQLLEDLVLGKPTVDEQVQEVLEWATKTIEAAREVASRLRPTA